jgi:protein tyrosine phosphatase (PTP) superfamily phosphohydrolase (DUF442 family)
MALTAFAGSKREVVTNNGVFTVSISNFGKVNDRYFRGGQPDREQYEELGAVGVKTVVDLRDDAKSYAKASAERAGLRYINFPMDSKRYPASDAADRFLKIVNDPANGPVFVHCAGGRHRTGAMTAVYRMTMDGWDADRAYREMKDYDFYSAWGHKPIKNYVYDYYHDLQGRHQAGAVLVRTSKTTPSISR